MLTRSIFSPTSKSKTVFRDREEYGNTLLKEIKIDTKPNGTKIVIPSEITFDNFDQQVKIFIELADYNFFDGQLHISLFRSFHGKTKTIAVLNSVVKELNSPTMKLDIQQSRGQLEGFFQAQLARHITSGDKEFGYPNDLSRLPL